MNLLREKLRARGHHVACFGGDSSSASTQQTTTTNIDNRSVTSRDSHDTYDSHNITDNSQRTFIDNSSTSVTTTDYGAISQANQLSAAALKQNATNTDNLFELADKLFASQKQTLDSNVKLAGQLSSNANEAYKGATAEATGSKTLMIVAVCAVGVVAVYAFMRKG